MTLQLTGAALAVPISITPDGVGGQAAGDVLPFGPSGFNFGDTTFQQITNASAFAALGGPMLLTSIDFSLNGGTPPAFYTGATIHAGVTPVASGSLTTNLSSNAPNPLTLVASSYAFTAVADIFDLRIVFDTPFLYNPADGNLILQYFSPASGNIRVVWSAGSSVTSGVFNSANSGSFLQSGIARVMQYNFIDAPPSADAPELDATQSLPAFLFIAGLCASGRRRARAAQA